MKPLRNYVLLIQKAPETKTASGIVLTGSADTGIKNGVVMAVGPDVAALEAGNEVVPDWSKGKPTTYLGQQAALISEDDILAIVE